MIKHITHSHEYHVASFIAHVLPKHSVIISQKINQHTQMEVHAISDQGKIVFTVEGESQNGMP